MRQLLDTFCLKSELHPSLLKNMHVYFKNIILGINLKTTLLCKIIHSRIGYGTSAHCKQIIFIFLSMRICIKTVDEKTFESFFSKNSLPNILFALGYSVHVRIQPGLLQFLPVKKRIVLSNIVKHENSNKVKVFRL